MVRKLQSVALFERIQKQSSTKATCPALLRTHCSAWDEPETAEKASLSETQQQPQACWFSIFFSHMTIQYLFWSCHRPFLWEDKKIAGTPHTGENRTFYAMTNTKLYQRRDYFRQTISLHVVPLSRDHRMASPLFLQSWQPFHSLAQLHLQSPKKTMCYQCI